MKVKLMDEISEIKLVHHLYGDRCHGTKPRYVVVFGTALSLLQPLRLPRGAQNCTLCLGHLLPPFLSPLRTACEHMGMSQSTEIWDLDMGS